MNGMNDALEGRIERYLLGRLTEEECSAMEALLFEDDRVLDAVHQVEDQLIDRYLAGEMSAQDRFDFERHFAAPTSRKRHVSFARALPHALAPQSQRRPRGRLVAPLAAAIAAALVGGGAFWWAAHLPSRPAAAPGPMPEASAAPSSGRESVEAHPPAAGPAPLALPRAELLRGRGGLPRLHLPANAAEVEVQAELEAPAKDLTYLVGLRTVEGESLWTGSARGQPGSRRLTVTLPARVFAPGDYVLNVRQPGQSSEDAPEFPFRVIGPSRQPAAAPPAR